MPAFRFRRKARTWRERHHPDSIEKRHAKGVQDRCLEYVPEQDGMARVSACLPADQAAAIWNRITAVARGLQSPDEDRTLTQLRADVFATAALRRDTGCTRCSNSTRAGAGAGPADVPTPRAEILVTVPAHEGHAELASDARRQMPLPRVQQPFPRQRGRPPPGLAPWPNHRDKQPGTALSPASPTQTPRRVETNPGNQERAARLGVTLRAPLQKRTPGLGTSPMAAVTSAACRTAATHVPTDAHHHGRDGGLSSDTTIRGRRMPARVPRWQVSCRRSQRDSTRSVESLVPCPVGIAGMETDM
ncbi:DUF222 domain-containing protein [Arthrobacter sp. SLBN-112]|uniref:DUF222 domain-containing protein n=1 Tax=Arthrobacter sp. SLBN-112 TaxID=2768452 RepID=UPI0028127F14|nr:DUF222 domain-containing protein [Arthrobacter sp. SLBN-112]